MNTTLFFSVILIVCHVVLALVGFFTGLQAENVRYLQYVQWLGAAVVFVVLYLGAEAKRKERPNQAFTFGGAFLAIFLIGLIAAVGSAVANYFHIKYLSPAFPDYMADHIRGQFVDQGMPESRIDGAVEMQRKLFQPGLGSVVLFVMSTLTAAVLGLLHGLALVRRRSLKSLLTIYALILGALGLIFGGLGGLMKHEFLLGAVKGLAINVAVAVIGWGALLKATGYAADAPPAEPTM
ncbi:MAG: DUF4199 domain-containing protein [Opitutae bacterium]|nr:DUF4199 domain-containing protein [Opitutae bacterium]